MGIFVAKSSLIFLCLTAFTLVPQFNKFAAEGVGINYGRKGDNLPTPDKVVALLKSRNIKMVRLFDPASDVLKALGGSGFELILGTLNGDLVKLGADLSFATNWVRDNVLPHASTIQFRYICAGNEVIPSNLANSVLPAIKNLDTALKSFKLNIPVSTAVDMGILGVSYPPSKGAFSVASGPIMGPIVTYLEANKVPLLLNVYPYKAYADDPKNIPLEYALFTKKEPSVHDPNTNLQYYNIFSAMVDAMYSALEKAHGPSVQIVVSESGWPSAGNGNIATVENARTYNNNLITHLDGTPKRPGKPIEAYIFALFNENGKEPGVERNYGIYRPDMTEVYHVNFP